MCLFNNKTSLGVQTRKKKNSSVFFQSFSSLPHHWWREEVYIKSPTKVKNSYSPLLCLPLLAPFADSLSLFKLLSLPLLQNHREKPHHTHTHIYLYIYIYIHIYFCISFLFNNGREGEHGFWVTWELGHWLTISPVEQHGCCQHKSWRVINNNNDGDVDRNKHKHKHEHKHNDNSYNSNDNNPSEQWWFAREKEERETEEIRRRWELEGVVYGGTTTAWFYFVSFWFFFFKKRKRKASWLWKLAASCFFRWVFLPFFLGKYHTAGCTYCLVAEKKV